MPPVWYDLWDPNDFTAFDRTNPNETMRHTYHNRFLVKSQNEFKLV